MMFDEFIGMWNYIYFPNRFTYQKDLNIFSDKERQRIFGKYLWRVYVNGVETRVGMQKEGNLKFMEKYGKLSDNERYFQYYKMITERIEQYLVDNKLIYQLVIGSKVKV